MKFSITTDDANQRLDIFLTEHDVAATRSQIKKLIQDGVAVVNGKPAKVHQFLKVGDVVEIIKTTKQKIVTSVATGPTPKIIHEGKHYIVLSKPTGLLVHPTAKRESNTLLDWLTVHHPTIKRIGEDRQRGGIVHRLDRDVSGVMVVAKTQKMFTSLKTQFSNRTVEKHYTALVYGTVPQETGDIELPIGRNKEGQFVAHPRRQGFKFHATDRVAKTRYTVLEYVKDYTLLDVEIFTGRTHQIRVHLSAIGHPILGDQLYQPRKKIFIFLQRRIKVISLPRIFLHATTLAFDDLNGERQTYTAPVPPTLTTILNGFKR